MQIMSGDEEKGREFNEETEEGGSDIEGSLPLRRERRRMLRTMW